MQFNDTSNKKGLVQECELLTGVGDAGISGDAATLDHFTRMINDRYYQVVTMVLQASDEWDFDDPNHTDKHATVTRALVADQRDYIFSTALWSLVATEGGSAGSNAAIKPLKIKRLDVCYDGIGNTCYRGTPLDTGEVMAGIGNDVNLDSRFHKSAPRYAVTNTGLKLYPRASTANVNNSGILRLEFTREIDEFADTDTTQEPGIDEPWHRMIAIGASLDWGIAKGLENQQSLSALWDRYTERLTQYYGTKQTDRDLTFVSGDSQYE